MHPWWGSARVPAAGSGRQKRSAWAVSDMVGVRGRKNTPCVLAKKVKMVLLIRWEIEKKKNKKKTDSRKRKNKRSTFIF